MSFAPRARFAAKALLLATPLLLPLLVPLDRLPPGLAFLLTRGGWLILVGTAAAVLASALPDSGVGRRSVWSRVEARLAAVPARAFLWGGFAVALAAYLALVPEHRWSGVSLGGDELKYLGMTDSLYRDLDVDVGSESLGPLTAERLARNLHSFGRAVGDALARVAESPPEGDAGRWRLGNWTVAGWHGGRYYVHPPGLPVLLLPGFALEEQLAPGPPGPILPLVTLGVLWAAAAVQTVLLAAEVGGSRLAAVLAGAAVALSPPVLITGLNVYPETAAAAAVAWLARGVRTGGAPLGALRAGLMGLAVGALPWLHPKFLPLSLAFAVLLALRLRRDRRKLGLALAAGAAPLLALLLFDHHVTGLWRPDAFYRRYGGDVYSGLGDLASPKMATGLVNALFAARDGLLIMAPVLAAGLMAIPLVWRHARGAALALALPFASVWIAAAVHGGGAPGPPGRLMVPAAALLAVPLALGLDRLRDRLAFPWTAAMLALVTGAISLGMLVEWKRSVNPYRHFARSPETNFALDLPDAPRDPSRPRSSHGSATGLARGLLLAAAVAFWAWRFDRGRRRPAADGSAVSRWRQLRDFHLGSWATLVLLAWSLHALGP
jgi:hypothetical protein